MTAFYAIATNLDDCVKDILAINEQRYQIGFVSKCKDGFCIETIFPPHKKKSLLIL